ncbi:NUDIX hydrolase [Limnofasciculus baicalensis]|uniref:NUDIX hydrolase n=1 Tax=Limnofasciculus baicalensis BBK-W-15 TaxID=2699891 RepID=A0AAE3GUN4_9CYAN|nr:NUDIX hydrolase [Limnofasciculus baicalensis]MCP2730098.1 NUDIX hydrolase [Limnofasciculus baicalensis BBK-W-15]
MTNQPVEVAIAILYRSGKFLMQLRDNIPGILYPGYWAFFGGHIEPGETPEDGVKREVFEEISYILPEVSKFRCYQDERVMRHVFHGPLTVELNQLVLTEGWDIGLLTPEQIRSGSCYSQKAEQFRPLGPIHQKILLDFIEIMGE